ncbi:MAG: hypothetical protein ACOX17_06325 [Christensenellales bacterium]|jgi:protein arginine kinase
MTDSLVMSNHIRIARNIVGVPFLSAMDERTKESTADVLSAACKVTLPSLQAFAMSDLNDIQRGVFLERRSISKRMAESHDSWKRLLLQKDESLAVNIHDMDHLRVQCMAEEADLFALYSAGDNFCKSIEKDICFVKHSRFGWLTASPEDTGTGTRVSVMIRLPALYSSRSMKPLAERLSENAVAMKAAYAEPGSNETGFYILYNSRTMGVSVEQTVEDVVAAVNLATRFEEDARERMLRKNRLALMDRCLRSYGILRYTLRISLNEARKRISLVWLAADMGWLDVKENIMRRLLLEIMPNHLAMLSQHEMLEDEERAARVRIVLGGVEE